MKKMKLNVAELRVESFAIVAEAAENGTVRGHEAPTATRPSCDRTCGDTCDYTCQTYACACLVSIGPTYCFCEDDTVPLP